ncbi:MAG TPA: M20 family metallopeptidase [bacterium]|nr:M20 family metallopeptidase [bacterium]
MSKTTLPWADEIRKREESLLALRRDFHKHPELSMLETRTAEVIAERLRAAGLEVRTGLAGTGVVGVLHGEKPGPVVAWRADIDALPLNEVPDVPFKSVNAGAMHACGHDGHTAIAITLAELLAARRAELPGTAVFICQPGEEVFGGAKPMIEAGALENPHVEQIYGLHLTTQDPAGIVSVKPGPAMASADFFNVEIRGMGGHGAFPHLSRDPITVAAHVVVGMQALVSREIPAQDTAVLTVGQIESGTKHNIIPERAVLRGSLRTYDNQIRAQLLERLGAFAARIAEAYRAEARIVFEGEGTSPVINPEPASAFVHRCFEEEVGADHVAEGKPVMASDDMALFLEQRPGAYFRVGVGPADREPAPHHNPNFYMDEAGLPVALRVALNVMLHALAGEG